MATSFDFDNGYTIIYHKDPTTGEEVPERISNAELKKRQAKARAEKRKKEGTSRQYKENPIKDLQSIVDDINKVLRKRGNLVVDGETYSPIYTIIAYHMQAYKQYGVEAKNFIETPRISSAFRKIGDAYMKLVGGSNLYRVGLMTQVQNDINSSDDDVWQLLQDKVANTFADISDALNDLSNALIDNGISRYNNRMSPLSQAKFVTGGTNGKQKGLRAVLDDCINTVTYVARILNKIESIEGRDAMDYDVNIRGNRRH